MTDATDLPRGIPAPATRALVSAGYRTLEDLNGVPAADLAMLHGMGPKALRALEEALKERGYALG